MKAVLYSIAIIVSLAGSFLIYGNTKKVKSQKEELTEVVNQKARIQKSIKREEQEIDRANQEVTELKTLVAEVNAQIDAAQSKQNALKKTLTRFENEAQEIEGQLEEFQSVIDEIESMLATVDMDDATELPDQIEALKADISKKEEQLESVNAIIVGLNQKVDAAKADKAQAQERLGSIKQNLRTNSMSGRVTAVDPDWGFVVINKGASNSTLKENTPLLVTRGGNYIGTISVSKLENSQAICEVPEDSSYSIQAGDRVILKNTVAQ